MQKLKKNLPIILGSVACTLLLVIVVILITNNGKFTFKNDTNNNDVKTNVKVKTNTDDIKVETEIKKDDIKVQTSNKEEKKEEVKDAKVETNTQSTNTINQDSIDNDILSYFEQQESLLDGSTTADESLTSKVKSGFTSVVDFIFYGKEIKGHTFKDLSESAKLKVTGIALSIDSKIDSYFPDYKAKMKDKYASMKEKISIKYEELKAYLCEKVGTDACNQAKEDSNNLKSKLSLIKEKGAEILNKAKEKSAPAVEKAKEKASSIKDAISEKYQNWRDK